MPSFVTSNTYQKILLFQLGYIILNSSCTNTQSIPNIFNCKKRI